MMSIGRHQYGLGRSLVGARRVLRVEVIVRM
jgi:hypothetical protein